MLKESVVTSQGYLQVLGYLSTVKLTTTCVRDEDTARDLQMPEVQQLYHSGREDPKHFYALTQDVDDIRYQSDFGTARFDNDAITSHSHACFIKKESLKSSPSHAWEAWLKREIIVRLLHFTAAYFD